MSMSERFDKLFERMKHEFKKQTMELTYSLTKNLSMKLEEKLKPLREENKNLKTEIVYLEKTVEYLERDSKRNNIIIFGFEETETSVSELLDAIKKKIHDDLNIYVPKQDINNVYRVGKRNKKSTKPRPVVISFIHAWKRNEVLRNKKRFRNIFVSEDFPKLVVEKRRLFLAELKEERKKGNIAYLVYDKLLVKPGKSENIIKDEKKDEEDLSQLLDGIEQCEQQQEQNKPRRRAKAMINRNTLLFDYQMEQNQINKPKSVKATINKKSDMSEDESEDEKMAQKSRDQATTTGKKKVSIQSSSEEQGDDEKPRRSTKLVSKKENIPNEKNREEIVGEKARPRATTNYDLLTEYVPQKRRMDY